LAKINAIGPPVFRMGSFSLSLSLSLSLASRCITCSAKPEEVLSGRLLASTLPLSLSVSLSLARCLSSVHPPPPDSLSSVVLLRPVPGLFVFARRLARSRLLGAADFSREIIIIREKER